MSESRYDHACHFVFDIETLGIKDDAAILEIAFVIVEPNDKRELQKTYSWHRAIDLETQKQYRVGNIELDSLKWWIGKGDVLKQIYETGPDNELSTFEQAYKTIAEVVDHFREKYNGNVFFWSRGSDFDFRILNSHIDAIIGTKDAYPWNFWEIRDIRTITNPMITKTNPTSNPHRAAQDALNEADDLIVAINTLSGK